MADLLVCYDAVEIANLPAGGDVLLGYAGGNWPTFAKLAAVAYGRTCISVAVNASETADILDQETGDATPTDCPGWLAEMNGRKPVRPAVIYCEDGTWAEVIDACKGVAPPRFRTYPADSAPTDLPAGCIGWQWRFAGSFDQSIVSAAWARPGSVPTPAPTGGFDLSTVPTIGPGSVDKFEIKAIQAILYRDYGQTAVAETGVYDAATQAAVENVQRFWKLPVDGIVGPATWAVLLEL